jgi:lipoprotein-releasing system ATP-binding protein
MSDRRLDGAAAEQPLIRAHGVRRWFELGGRRIDVLRGVDLEIRAGEMLAIVGRSGSGKSTLLHVLGALDHPSDGEVTFEGRSLRHADESTLAAFRNRTIGFVFQFHHLLPELTALENVLMPALIARRARAEVLPQALELLGLVGLRERLEHHPGELSGGEQQRVALARALIMSPRVVLADEPTGNLDGRTAEEVHQLMERLNAETGTGFVIVSHNPGLAARMPRVVEMVDGRIADLQGGSAQDGRHGPTDEALA